eukprot:15485853-Alexandrium_andersonii.AAC.1
MAQRDETHIGAPPSARRPERPRRHEQGSHCRQQRGDPRVAQGARNPQPMARGPRPFQRTASAAPPQAAGRPRHIKQHQRK